MDNLKQLGKTLKGNSHEADMNIRRFSENIALIERSVDKVNPSQKFVHNFNLSDHPHNVHLNLSVKEVEAPCELSPIEEFASLEARCPSFGPADGVQYPGTGDTVVSSVGGFEQAAEGWVVPIDGIYEIHFVNSVAGVANPSTVVTGSIRVGGAVVSQAVYGSTCELCFYAVSVDIYATMELAAGSVVSGWLGAYSLAFYTPSNLCGLFGGSYLSVTLVAQP